MTRGIQQTRLRRNPTRNVLARVSQRVAIWREIARATTDRLLHPGRPPKKQIVVCGFPRSGTSLLYNMLSTTLDCFEFAEFEEPARANLWKYVSVASKRPLDVLEIPSFPRHNIHGKDVFVVICIRDIRDIVTSIHPTGPCDRYYIGYNDQWAVDRNTNAPVKTMGGVKLVYDAIEVAKEVKGIVPTFIRYEELVECPDAVQERLAGILDVEFIGKFSYFHKSPEKHAYSYSRQAGHEGQTDFRENAPVDKSRVGKWRRQEHFARIREEFNANPELFAILREYEYEQSDDWFQRYLASDTCVKGP